MGTLNLRAALFLAFAAFLVVQCSGDSSEQFEEPSDEIKRLLSSPEMPSELSSPEMPSDEPSDRRKRSPFGNFFSALFRRNGGGGGGPPPANSTGVPPAAESVSEAAAARKKRKNPFVFLTIKKGEKKYGISLFSSTGSPA
ncbi:hypothetical protein GPALN_005088 [Globodera pallida]|nr:hypothetical protein GPALN_005088 [Globodera pallida]